MRFPTLHSVLWPAALLLGAAPVRAELRAPTPMIELGEVRGGQRLMPRFDLVNAGTEPLEIVDVQRGCGCLAPRLGERVVRPGAKVQLAFELRTLGQADGPHVWHAQVRYRQGGEVKSLALALRGAVRNDIRVEPAILGLHVEKATQKEIVVTDTRPTPLRVVGAESRAPAVKVADIRRDGKTTRVVLAVDPTVLAAGRHEGLVHIFTDDRDYEELQVPVTVTKAQQAAVRIVPEQPEIRLGNSGAGVVVVRLRSTGDMAVRVEGVETDAPALQATWAAGPGNDATLRLAYRGLADGGPNRPQEIGVRVRLAGGATQAFTVQVRGE